MLNLVVHVANMSQDSLLGVAAPCLLNVPGIKSRAGSTRPPVQWGTCFDVLLTVHLGTILVINQLDAQNLVL